MSKARSRETKPDGHPTTIERWNALWKREGANVGLADVYGSLIDSYSEKNRAYHNLSHISDCLKEFDQAKQLLKNKDDVEVAIWFHDIIYDTKRGDNEERSAEFAYKVAKSVGLSEGSAKRIHDYILATKHKGTPRDNDAKFVMDIDLSSLGASQETFETNSSNIRKEYSWVSEHEFKIERTNFLNYFLNRPGIYMTSFFRKKYEEIAKENIKSYLAKLK